jgi:hypothetical protein
MGDHVPAFLMRDLRGGMTEDEPAAVEAEDPAEPATTEPVAIEPVADTPRPARRRRVTASAAA